MGDGNLTDVYLQITDENRKMIEDFRDRVILEALLESDDDDNDTPNEGPSAKVSRKEEPVPVEKPTPTTMESTSAQNQVPASAPMPTLTPFQIAFYQRLLSQTQQRPMMPLEYFQYLHLFQNMYNQKK